MAPLVPAAPTGAVSSAGKGRIPLLDGIRGLAALMVMAFHYFQISDHLVAGRLGAALHRYSTIGQTGVDLFFVLSGFLITRILLQTRERPGYFVNFYARRSLRILPLYYWFLLLFFFVQPLLGEERPAPFGQTWWWWVYLQNLPLTFGWPAVGPNHYWSLAVEEHFYLIWPLLVFVLSRRNLVFASLGMVAAALATRVVLLANGLDGFYFTFSRLDALALGALLALLEPAVLARPDDFRKYFLILAGMLCIPLGALYLVFAGSHAIWLQAVKYPLTGLAYFIFLGLALMADPRSRPARFFASRTMRFLGGISYGMYVYHPLCFVWQDRLLPTRHPLLFLPLEFLVPIGMAYLSFKWLEAPFLRLKDRFGPPAAA